jgi:hypothetical protein
MGCTTLCSPCSEFSALCVKFFPCLPPRVFNNLHTLFPVPHAPPLSVVCGRFCKNRGEVWGQRGRGRSGGRAVSGLGRMRKRGPSGGGTLRRKSPQQGQRPSMPKGRVASARSQWPRASHCGLMHCTVKPGRYCMSFPLSDRRLFAAPVEVVRTRIPLRRTNDWRGFWRRCCRGVKRKDHNI